MIACAEALGPVRFAGWDEGGRPLGMPVKSPLIRCVATEEGQADNVYAMVEFMLRHGDVAATPGLDVGMTRTFLPDGGAIKPITAKATSKDGGRETFVVFDETHLFVTPELVKLHATIRRNLGKRKESQPWSLEVSTMYAPDEGSVAESTHAYAQAVQEGTIKDASLLFDHRSAPLEFDWADDDQLRAALAEAYGEAAEWMDLDRLVAEARDPQTLESDFRRYFLNQPTKSENAWFAAGVFDACADYEREVEDGTEICLGFDGSERRDATALVGCTLDGHVFVIGVWERPPNAAKDWRVPRDEVDAAVYEAMRRWKVRELVCDPWGWESEMDDWRNEFGSLLVEFKMTPSIQAPATSKFTEAVQEQTMTHDGDERLVRHVGNAVRKPMRNGYFIDKPAKHSLRKIDVAVAAILAYERATALSGTGVWLDFV